MRAPGRSRACHRARARRHGAERRRAHDRRGDAAELPAPAGRRGLGPAAQQQAAAQPDHLDDHRHRQAPRRARHRALRRHQSADRQGAPGDERDAQGEGAVEHPVRGGTQRGGRGLVGDVARRAGARRRGQRSHVLPFPLSRRWRRRGRAGRDHLSRRPARDAATGDPAPGRPRAGRRRAVHHGVAGGALAPVRLQRRSERLQVGARHGPDVPARGDRAVAARASGRVARLHRGHGLGGASLRTSVPRPGSRRRAGRAAGEIRRRGRGDVPLRGRDRGPLPGGHGRSHDADRALRPRLLAGRSARRPEHDARPPPRERALPPHRRHPLPLRPGRPARDADRGRDHPRHRPDGARARGRGAGGRHVGTGADRGRRRARRAADRRELRGRPDGGRARSPPRRPRSTMP